MGKIFLMDIAKCNGCHDCQIACKDEFCSQDWMPYSKAQPETGQFWCKVEETVHGSVPKVNITYRPVIGAQNDKLAEYAPEVLEPRDDGIIVLDPEKCTGRRDIAEKFDGVFYNEELDTCQGCTGCAHLLDDGWTVPRCVDACPTGALRFGDEKDFASELEEAEQLEEGSRVYYLNVPKRWVAGAVYDPEADEVVIGATVTLESPDGTKLTTRTDDFGDFWFRQIDPADYSLTIETDGYLSRTIDANAIEADVNVGEIALNTEKAWQEYLPA